MESVKEYLSRSSWLIRPVHVFPRAESVEAYRRIFNNPDDRDLVQTIPETEGTPNIVVPRFEARLRRLTTQLHIPEMCDKVAQVSLRGFPGPEARQANHAFLVADGVRSYKLPDRETLGPPRWRNKLNTWHDCTSAWDVNQREHLPMRLRELETKAGVIRITLATHARGVIYSRQLLLDDDMRPAGYLVRVTIVLIRLNPDWERLEIKLIPHVYRSEDPDKVPPVVLDGLDRAQQPLLDRAMDMFNQRCRPIPLNFQTWRSNFLIQCDKEESAQGRAFEERVIDMPWQEALAQVEEPWQLAIVLDQHADRRFDNGVRLLTHKARVMRLLEAAELPVERKAMLEKMIADYVKPADDEWDIPIRLGPSRARPPNSNGPSRPHA